MTRADVPYALDDLMADLDDGEAVEEYAAWHAAGGRDDNVAGFHRFLADRRRLVFGADDIAAGLMASCDRQRLASRRVRRQAAVALARHVIHMHEESECLGKYLDRALAFAWRRSGSCLAPQRNAVRVLRRETGYHYGRDVLDTVFAALLDSVDVHYVAAEMIGACVAEAGGRDCNRDAARVDATRFAAGVLACICRGVLCKPPAIPMCARALAYQVRRSRRFADLPILADMLEDTGWTDADALVHLRHGLHYCGCHVLDAIR